MNENIKVFLQICGITFIVFLVSVSFVSYFGNSGLVWSVAWGYGISLVNILFAYYSITWAFDKPNKTFFGVVIGGMGIRFITLLTALFVVWKFTQIPFTGFVVSLVGFYLTLQVFEVRFVQKRLNNRKAIL